MNATILSCGGCGAHLPIPKDNYAKCESCGGINHVSENKIQSVLTRTPAEPKQKNNEFSKLDNVQAALVIVAAGIAMAKTLKKWRK